ncbi:MAG: hypothetical protein AAF598_05465 [Bacteroidota bacterium]
MRVFPNGETFLSVEKGVDYVKTIRALYYFVAFADDRQIAKVVDRVLGFYR